MFEIHQHTADIRIVVKAATREALFADSVRALMDVMKPKVAPEGAPVTISVESPDMTALLIDFLNEVVLRCHTRHEAFQPESFVLEETSAVARLTARAATHFEEDVKAVTYHEADVRRMADGTWITTLVLDV